MLSQLFPDKKYAARVKLFTGHLFYKIVNVRISLIYENGLNIIACVNKFKYAAIILPLTVGFVRNKWFSDILNEPVSQDKNYG